MFVVWNTEVILSSRALNYPSRCIIAAPVTGTEKPLENAALLSYDLQSL